MIHFFVMAYRPTERTEARKARTREAIVGATRELVAEGGWEAAQVKAVAARAGVATGTVYRHFPSKAELLCEVFRTVAGREVAAVARASAGPGRAADRVRTTVETFAHRALDRPRLAWALIAEPVGPSVEAERLAFRRAYRDAIAAPVADGVEDGELPPQDPELTAASLVGALAEALAGPLAPTGGEIDREALVEGIAAFCTRSLTEESHVHLSH